MLPRHRPFLLALSFLLTSLLVGCAYESAPDEGELIAADQAATSDYLQRFSMSITAKCDGTRYWENDEQYDVTVTYAMEADIRKPYDGMPFALRGQFDVGRTFRYLVDSYLYNRYESSSLGSNWRKFKSAGKLKAFKLPDTEYYRVILMVVEPGYVGQDGGRAASGRWYYVDFMERNLCAWDSGPLP